MDCFPDDWPVLYPAEHDLDAVAPLVSALVILDRRLALLPAGDAGPYPLVLQRLSQPVSIITAIAKQLPDVWQAAEQRPCADIIAHLSGCDEQIERSSLAVADGVRAHEQEIRSNQYGGSENWLPCLS